LSREYTPGETINRLTFVRKTGSGRWLFTCACGAEHETAARSVFNGRVKSCGCLGRELTTERNIRHGGAFRVARRPEYIVWVAMRKRCRNPQSPDYPRYGGRGINVCARWEDFGNFISDMGPRPSARHSIDRVNNDGNYEPGNCRWTTPDVQAANRKPPRKRP
jgi:hypothetical protein